MTARRPESSGVIAAAGRVRIGGKSLRYRCDGRRPWSFLDHRLADLARSAPHRVRFDDSGDRADLVFLETPWGELRCLLWELGGTVDLVAGREALGRPSPAPRRTVLLFDDLDIGAGVGGGPGAQPPAMEVERRDEQFLGRLIQFPVRRR